MFIIDKEQIRLGKRLKNSILNQTALQKWLQTGCNFFAMKSVQTGHQTLGRLTYRSYSAAAVILFIKIIVAIYCNNSNGLADHLKLPAVCADSLQPT